MNLWLIAAALSAAILAVAHSYLGERLIIAPLLHADLSGVLSRERFQKKIIRFAWHLTSVAWLGFAGVIIGLKRPDSVAFIGTMIAATFIIHAFITAFSSKGKHFAWVLFLLVALGSWLGSRM